MVVDAFSRKAESMGNLSYIPVGERSLALDDRALANRLVRLDVSEPSWIVAYMVSQSSLYERIKARQCDDPHLLVLKDMVQHGDAKERGLIRLGRPFWVGRPGSAEKRSVFRSQQAKPEPKVNQPIPRPKCGSRL
ncbi:uncharacterized protein [Nicotiana tomentosiformis]|uniref:uncharacterized protein n=1 Tax=Nicotiana tomentosiformis TaxID=4098 RepID=UPI00388CCFC8